MPTDFSIVLQSMISVVLLFQVLAGVALTKRRNDLADVYWGLGFVVAVWTAAFSRQLATFGFTEIVILICVSVWGLRLAWHVGQRFRKASGEDARYARWRKEWGLNWAWRSYLQVFLLQSIILCLIALAPVTAIAAAPRSFSGLVLFGVILWSVGFFFEAVGDRQLQLFTADPANKGKLIDTGLWAWSRHPNYFGEVVQWWGIFLMAVEPATWWLMLSPLVITGLILKVSGVPMLEEIMAKRPGWAEYAARVSIFFPRPPKRS